MKKPTYFNGWSLEFCKCNKYDSKKKRLCEGSGYIKQSALEQSSIR